MNTKTLQYTTTPIGKISGKKATSYHVREELKDISILPIILYVLERTVWPHRFKISLAINIWVGIVWVFPFAPDLVVSLMSGIL